MFCSMFPDLTKRMMNEVTRQHCGPRMKGYRHEYLSAKIANSNADIAPTAYGGMVMSWAIEDVYPMPVRMLGMVNFMA